MDSESRVLWRLVSPSARRISCHLRRVGAQFELSVSGHDGVIVRFKAPELEPLQTMSAEWRSRLESRGYVVESQVRSSNPVAGGTPSEARTAFLGILECAEVLAEANRAVARELRNQAIAGLVATNLADVNLALDVFAEARAALETLEREATPGLEPVIASCRALLNKAEKAIADG